MPGFWTTAKCFITFAKICLKAECPGHAIDSKLTSPIVSWPLRVPVLRLSPLYFRANCSECKCMLDGWDIWSIQRAQTAQTATFGVKKEDISAAGINVNHSKHAVLPKKWPNGRAICQTRVVCYWYVLICIDMCWYVLIWYYGIMYWYTLSYPCTWKQVKNWACKRHRWENIRCCFKARIIEGAHWSAPSVVSIVRRLTALCSCRSWNFLVPILAVPTVFRFFEFMETYGQSSAIRLDGTGNKNHWIKAIPFWIHLSILID